MSKGNLPDDPGWYMLYSSCPCSDACNKIKCHAKINKCLHSKDSNEAQSSTSSTGSSPADPGGL